MANDCFPSQVVRCSSAESMMDRQQSVGRQHEFGNIPEVGLFRIGPTKKTVSTLPV